MTLSAVQTTVYDTFGQYYQGQLVDYGSYALSSGVRNFRTETVLVFGRGVVKGTANAQQDPVATPYGVKAPLSGSVDADFVGIAVLIQSSSSNADNLPVTIRATTMVPVVERYSGAIVGALVPNGVTIANDDPVYMSVSHVSIPVGGFTNASGGGLILINGLKWYGAAAQNTVGRIYFSPQGPVGPEGPPGE